MREIMFRGKKIYTVTFHENLWGKDVAVIGNIFDHPELIGGGEE